MRTFERMTRNFAPGTVIERWQFKRATMPYQQLTNGIDFSGEGRAMHALATKLFPICRSITGDGMRATLHEIASLIPLSFHEVPTDTRVLDWTVPREWNIRDAYIADLSGNRLIDFGKNNLHVVNYSIPVRARLSLPELKSRMHTLPQYPDWVPYRTSYYQEDWGFCMSQRQLETLTANEYDVCIDSSLKPGSLTYGEYFIQGSSTDEVLISCHACHPSLANDNLSGVVLSVALARILSSTKPRLSYRFLFIPGTIGSIVWLARNESATKNIKAGFVVACVGDTGSFHYKKSRRGNAPVDLAVAHALQRSGKHHQILEFSPYGYDERQYCSPGFDLPVGSLTRTPHGRYPEYHTSADNLSFIRSDALAESLQMYLSVLEILENNRVCLNLSPKGEPQLGKRGLYRPTGGLPNAGEVEMALLWVLNLSDNTHTLLEIAERSGLPFSAIVRAADRLEESGLLRS